MLLVARRTVLVLAALLTLCCTVLFVAMRMNDARIGGDLGTATATVLSVSPLRTGIEFVDLTGTAVRPPDGVLYPGLLTVGQEFQVEYALSDPTLVRVAGRTAAVGDLMVLGAVVATWAVAGLLWWILRRVSDRPRVRGLRRRDASSP